MAEGETPTRLRLREKLTSIEKALRYAYTGSSERGSFLRGTANEYVPNVFMLIYEMRGLLNDVEASDTVAAAPQPKTCATCRHALRGSRFLWCQREPSPTMGEAVEPDYFCALFESKGHAPERTEP